MKQFISLLFLTLVILISPQAFGQSSEKLRSIQKKNDSSAVDSSKSFTCPVHPGIKAEKPGKCPLCGRNLVQTENQKIISTCPRHPEVQQNVAGVCPKCGRKLIQKENSAKENLKQKYPKS